MNLAKLILVMSLSMIQIACQSQANLARNNLAVVCSGSFESTNRTMQLPPEAKVLESERKKFGSSVFVPASRYNALLRHAKELAECGKGSQCLIEHTEYERDCEAEWAESLESSFIPGFLRFRSSCKIPKPQCEIDI